VPKTLSGFWINALLILCSLLLCFAVLESGVRFFDITRATPPIRHEKNPDQLVSFVAGSERLYETEEFRIVIKANRFGRRDREWTESMIRDPRNILFIGDSMVAGDAVAYEATIPTQIESRIAKTGITREVFNFGIPGGQPPDYVELMDIALAHGIRAETVIVGLFVGNDFYPSVLDPQEPTLPTPPPTWELRSELWRLLRFRVSNSTRIIGWFMTLGQMTGVDVYGTAGSYVYLREQTAQQQAVFQNILAFVKEIKERCDDNGSTLFVVAIPNKIQVENAEDLNNSIYDGAKPNRLILEYCEKIGLECLDLLPVLRSAHSEGKALLYFPIDRHLTPTGTGIVADAIVDFLAAVGS